MYHFAIVALLGLVTLKLVELLEELVPQVGRFRTLLTFALAVTGVVLIDYSLFSGFDITVRDASIGTWITGLIVGSLAAAWTALLGYVGSGRAVKPEMRTSDRPRVAA